MCQSNLPVAFMGLCGLIAFPLPGQAPLEKPQIWNPLANVTVFGTLDLFLSSTHLSNGTVTRLGSSGLLASRLGFKGSEDLGGELKLNYLLEAGVNADTGAQPDPPRLFNRQSWVGLSGFWGELRFGRQNSPQFYMMGKFDAFTAGTEASGLNNLKTSTPRFDNLIAYQSPSFQGLSFQALYGLGESTTTPTTAKHGNDNFHLVVEYEQGSNYLGANHTEVKNALNTMTTKSTFLGGSHDFGAWKTYLVLHHAMATDDSLNKDLYSVSALYRVTPRGSLAFGYAKAFDRTAARNDGDEYSLLYRFARTKRTEFYGALSWLTNHRMAGYTLNGAAVTGAPLGFPGDDPRGVQIGIKHLF